MINRAKMALDDKEEGAPVVLESVINLSLNLGIKPFQLN